MEIYSLKDNIELSRGNISVTLSRLDERVRSGEKTTLEYAAAKQMDMTIKELETARKFYLNAYRATRQRVENRRVEQTWDVTEDANSDENSVAKNPAKEYNEEVSYSLYTDDVMFSSRYNKVTQSQDMRELYNGAKRGDAESAYRLLTKLLSEDVINKIGSFGKDVHLVPVYGAEGTSTNVLPVTIAKHISAETGQNVFKGVCKEDTSDSRNVNIWGRMKENYPSFVFDENSNVKTNDISGRKFVLIDDNSTTGRTFVGLKNFLEENGGEVVGYYALTTGQDQSEKMVTTDETWNNILSIGLDDVRGFAEKEGVKREISKLGLTEREAQELIKQFRNKKTDTGRGDEGVSGIRSGGRKVRTVYEAEKKRGAGEQDYSLMDDASYTEQEYRDYGWARENGILTADQNADFRSKFALAKSGQMKFPKSKKGELIIPFDETNLDRTRRFIYDSERRGIQPKAGGVFERYYSYHYRVRQQGNVFESDGDSSDDGYGGRSGRETSEVERGVGKQDHSLKDEVEVSPKRTKELLDTSPQMRRS